jgi:DNA-directed RNA polymerase subunit M
MTIFKEKITHKKEDFRVATEENIMAVYPHKCKKCGYEKAQLIECGIWIGDEDQVIRYKCGKCGHVEDVSEKPK